MKKNDGSGIAASTFFAIRAVPVVGGQAILVGNHANSSLQQ
jgi:hypothetical protein